MWVICSQVNSTQINWKSQIYAKKILSRIALIVLYKERLQKNVNVLLYFHQLLDLTWFMHVCAAFYSVHGLWTRLPLHVHFFLFFQTPKQPTSAASHIKSTRDYENSLSRHGKCAHPTFVRNLLIEAEWITNGYRQTQCMEVNFLFLEKKNWQNKNPWQKNSQRLKPQRPVCLQKLTPQHSPFSVHTCICPFTFSSTISHESGKTLDLSVFQSILQSTILSWKEQNKTRRHNNKDTGSQNTFAGIFLLDFRWGEICVMEGRGHDYFARNLSRKKMFVNTNLPFRKERNGKKAFFW